MKRKRSIFVLTAEGKLLVELRAVMHPICALVDGLPITFFRGGRNKRTYLEIDRAIDWCKKEMQHHDETKYEKMIAVMEKVKTQVRDEAAS